MSRLFLKYVRNKYFNCCFRNNFKFILDKLQFFNKTSVIHIQKPVNHLLYTENRCQLSTKCLVRKLTLKTELYSMDGYGKMHGIKQCGVDPFRNVPKEGHIMAIRAPNKCQKKLKNLPFNFFIKSEFNNLSINL